MDRAWVCDRCGWNAGTDTPKDADACDSCGGELVCSECMDYPEFCDCEEPTDE